MSVPSNRRLAVEFTLLGLVVALILWGLFLAGRWALDRAVMAAPRSLDRVIGDAAAAAFDKSGATCADPAAVAAIAAVTATLVQAAGDDLGEPPGSGAAIAVRVHADAAVNAFALPGGHVYVLSGLIDAAESVDEVAGVLGHEIGHVAHRHHLRNLGRQVGVAAALGVVLGDADGVARALAAAASQLSALAFSRGQEEDADEYGLALAARAGYDPLALGAFLGRLDDAGLPAFLLDHPAPADRRERLARLAADLPPRGAAAAATPALADIQGKCRKE